MLWLIWKSLHLSATYVIDTGSFQESNHYIPKKESTVHLFYNGYFLRWDTHDDVCSQCSLRNEMRELKCFFCRGACWEALMGRARVHMLSWGLSSSLTHSPFVVVESCRIDGGLRVPPPAWPDGTHVVDAVSGHGCWVPVGCYRGERKKQL